MISGVQEGANRQLFRSQLGLDIESAHLDVLETVGIPHGIPLVVGIQQVLYNI